jgi:large subunit ribosomal protein L13
VLREADHILQEEIRKAGLYRELWQSFCVLPDVRTVGVQGDERTYGYVVVIRAVTSDDAMTADWARLPYDLLETIASRMINELREVNRVVLRHHEQAAGHHRVGVAARSPTSPMMHPRRRADSRGLFHVMAPSTKTYVAKPTDRERNWLIVDANGKTLGRLATQIADVLRGKRKPEYTPHIDTGDFVVVINAEKIHVSGNKRQDKRYYRHSGYPGGLRSRTFEEMIARRPEEIIRLAVKGMMPRNRLARKQITKLKIYAGPEHPHVAQKPQPLGDRGLMADEETPETPDSSPRPLRARRPDRGRPGDRRLGRGRGARGRPGGAGVPGGQTPPRAGRRRSPPARATPSPPPRPRRSPARPRMRGLEAARGGRRGRGRGGGARAAREARGSRRAPRSGHRPRGRRPARPRRGVRGPLRPRRRWRAGEQPAGEQDETLTEPIATAAIDLASGARYRATGKRKTAIAASRCDRAPAPTPSTAARSTALPAHTLQRNIRQPLETVGYQDRMDVVARLHGGGISAQAGALRHGVSRALLEADPNLRGELKRGAS